MNSIRLFNSLKNIKIIYTPKSNILLIPGTVSTSSKVKDAMSIDIVSIDINFTKP